MRIPVKFALTGYYACQTHAQGHERPRTKSRVYDHIPNVKSKNSIPIQLRRVLLNSPADGCKNAWKTEGSLVWEVWKPLLAARMHYPVLCWSGRRGWPWDPSLYLPQKPFICKFIPASKQDSKLSDRMEDSACVILGSASDTAVKSCVCSFTRDPSGPSPSPCLEGRTPSQKPCLRSRQGQLFGVG